MDTEMKLQLARSLREDLLDCIDKARNGLLSPYWQDYCREEIAAAKGTYRYPADGDALVRQLQAAIAATPQITERDQEAAELARLGGRLLFFFYLDRDTFLEIAACPGAGYDGLVSISPARHGGHLPATAAAMRQALEAWLPTAGFSPEEFASASRPANGDDGRFPTLRDAVTAVYAGLNCPASVLQ